MAGEAGPWLRHEIAACCSRSDLPAIQRPVCRTTPRLARVFSSCARISRGNSMGMSPL